MRDLVNAIRQSQTVRLVDDWYAEFVDKRDFENQYSSERDWKLTAAVRVLKDEGIACRKEESSELSAMAQIIKEEPDNNLLKTERRQDHAGK